MNGEGVYTWPSGSRYEGTWENGRINGFGTLTYSNNDQYEGEWLDGKMHGRGTYRYREPTSCLEPLLLGFQAQLHTTNSLAVQEWTSLRCG